MGLPGVANAQVNGSIENKAHGLRPDACHSSIKGNQ
jgi:hypothetical protein